MLWDINLSVGSNILDCLDFGSKLAKLCFAKHWKRKIYFIVFTQEHSLSDNMTYNLNKTQLVKIILED